jgi:hypothetical protein
MGCFFIYKTCISITLHKHSCILLRVEHQGEFAIEEEVVPQTEEPPAENNLYFDIRGEGPVFPEAQGKPRCIYPTPC